MSSLQKKFPKVPISCLTASATPEVKKDIIVNLKITQLIIFQSSFNRPNLL